MTYSYYPPDVLPEGFCVTRGENDVLFTADGREYIDLLSGSGTVFLGHANPAIGRRIKEQMDLLWTTGAVPTQVGIEARSAVEDVLPPSHQLAVLYSTGMEAVEFAIRVVRHVTGRKGIAGFSGCMHGKSMAAARLGWPNDLATLPDFHSLPYLPQNAEDVILEQTQTLLAKLSIAAVFLEPLLGSRGGHIPSRQFAQDLARQCTAAGTLLVMDEIFTGFYRTGGPFLHQDLGVTPDILLIGKAMGNGFPVSGVVLDRRYPIEGRMLPGSTFAGNPLAAAAVVSTLSEMRTHDMSAKVGKLEKVIVASLSDLEDGGIVLRGRGALWMLDLPRSVNVSALMARIVGDGVIVSQTANFVRLLPAATMSPAHLTQACGIIRRACQAQLSVSSVGGRAAAGKAAPA